MSAPVTRQRAEAIVETVAQSQRWTKTGFHGGSHSEEELRDVAEALGVPHALLWLAVGQVTGEQIDELTAWWPRKEA